MAPFSKKIEDCVESLFHVVVSPSATLYSFALSDTFTLKQKRRSFPLSQCQCMFNFKLENRDWKGFLESRQRKVEHRKPKV